VEASSLIQREYEQKVCFRATKTKGKKRNLFLAALSADFYFCAIGSKSRSRSAPTVDAFYGRNELRKTAGCGDCLILNGYIAIWLSEPQPLGMRHKYKSRQDLLEPGLGTSSPKAGDSRAVGPDFCIFCTVV